MRQRLSSLFLAFVVNILLPVALVAGTVLLVRPMLNKKKPQPSSGPPTKLEHEAETVQVFELQPIRARSKIQSTGVATPLQKMTLVPELNARVTWVSKDLTVGGRLRKGQILVRLDKKDFALRLRGQKNQIAKAELDLEVEKERAKLAKRELALLERGKDLPSNTNRDLASRTHHLQVAKVALDAAKSGLEQAQVQLARTVIRAPFDAVVLSESVEPGQVVGPGSVIATLIGADALHVRAKIPVEQLANLVLQGDPKARTKATVALQGAGKGGASWSAYADRLVHELDSQSMDAQVLFVVQDPFSGEDGRMPLLAGSLVKLEIQGRQDREVYKVPRKALVQGQSLWTLAPGDQLHRVDLEILWSDRNHVYAKKGQLTPGTKALTRPPRSQIEGAKVHVTDPLASKETM